MPITWQYADVYGVIIHYITEHLDPTNYLLNFGIIAIHDLGPKVMLRFTLKNIRNNLKQSLTQLLEGETLEDLFDGVYGAVEIIQIENSDFIDIMVNIIIICNATNLFFVSAMINDMLN